jgi:hypothetical protein
MERATSNLREKNRLCWSEWRLDDRSRFDWSQEAGTIVFSGPEGQVTADIQFIGSWSADTNTWMWAWHNESIAHHLKTSVLDVKRYGEIHDLPELKEAILDGPIEAAWDMTSLSCYILQSDMGYRAPDSTTDNFTFLSLSNFRKMVEQSDAANPCPSGTSVTEAACAPSAPEASRDT